MNTRTLLEAILLIVLVTFLGVGHSHAGDTINGAGATFPYPVYSAWAYAYYKQTGIRLNYQSIGSGGGVRQIINRTVDFGATDAPVRPEKLEKERLYQFPTVIGGVVPVVNIPGVKNGELRLDGETICGIFLGEITLWNDERIQRLNPALTLPSKRITVVHRSDGSGTTAIFTTYLSQTCRRWKERVGAGKSVKWPAGIGAKGNEGVANYVKRLKGSIGYVEFAYAKQNRMNHVVLKNPAGNFVEPGFESFKEAASSARFEPEKHFYLWLVNAPGRNAWPIAGATFILLAREKTESNIKTVRFFDWAYRTGDEVAKRLVYVPLPQNLKDKIREYWRKNGIY